jgi:hypothetical protein
VGNTTFEDGEVAVAGRPHESLLTCRDARTIAIKNTAEGKREGNEQRVFEGGGGGGGSTYGSLLRRQDAST